MTTDPLTVAGPNFKVGDRVRLIAVPAPGGLSGRVVELRGPLGPNGTPVYGVRLRRRPFGPHGKSRYSYIEVGADQIELVPAAG